MPARRQSKKRNSRAKSVSFKRASSRSNVTGKGRYTVRKRAVRSRVHQAPAGPLETLGRMAGKAIGGWLGSGDYVSTSGNTVLAPDPPKISMGRDAVTITHREYLGDIISSSTANTFKIQKFGLNPSDMNTFPWLANVTQPNYQQFQFEQLIFEFRTFSADALNSTNTALGSVFACINYDYSDPDISSRQQVENTDWANACKPSESMFIPVECDPKQTGLNNGLLYIINGNNVPTGADPKTYYLGKLFIGTTGLQGTSVNVGSLYVHYKVKLYKPVMTAPASNALVFTRAASGNSSSLWGDTLLSSPANCDSIGITINGNTLTMDSSRLQVGQIFEFSFTAVGTPTAINTQPTITLSSGLEGRGWNSTTVANDTWYLQAPAAGASITSARLFFTFVCAVIDSSSDQTVTIGGAPSYPAAAVCNLRIAQICGIPRAQIGYYIP